MKNKLFYLFGAAFLLCSTGVFTSCSSDDDPAIEQPADGGDEDDALSLNGNYDDATLKMTYNGEELTGKRVSFTANESLTKATILLSGVEKDLTDMLGGIIGELKFTTNSPIPGEKEIKLENVALTANTDGTTYSFEGKDENSNRTMHYKGTVKDGEMNIEITNELQDKSLAGIWNLADVKVDGMMGGTTCQTSAPLWIDWDSFAIIDPGVIEGVSGLNQSPNSLFTWLIVLLADPFMIENNLAPIDLKVQEYIKNMLQSVTAQPNGCMFATYSYSGDVTNPAWSSEMSHNIIRYYQGSEPGKLYIEVNTEFILNAIGGLLTPTRADGQSLDELIKPVIEALRPAIENGFPCTYEINGNKMKINLDGAFTRDILLKLVTLLNTPSINSLIMELFNSNETIKPYAENVRLLLSTLPNALTYKGTEDNPNDHTGVCEFVKVGLQLVKAAE